MRYHLDEDLSRQIAHLARDRFGLDVTSVQELRTYALTDEEQLAFATAEGRCLVTRNRDDFVALNARAIAAGLTYTSILVVPRSIPGDQFLRTARALAYHHHLYPGEAIPNYLDFLRDAPANWQP